jgi:hypothetical protein
MLLNAEALDCCYCSSKASWKWVAVRPRVGNSLQRSPGRSSPRGLLMCKSVGKSAPPAARDLGRANLRGSRVFGFRDGSWRRRGFSRELARQPQAMSPVRHDPVAVRPAACRTCNQPPSIVRVASCLKRLIECTSRGNFWTTTTTFLIWRKFNGNSGRFSPRCQRHSSLDIRSAPSTRCQSPAPASFL